MSVIQVMFWTELNKAFGTAAVVRTILYYRESICERIAIGSISD